MKRGLRGSRSKRGNRWLGELNGAKRLDESRFRPRRLGLPTDLHLHLHPGQMAVGDAAPRAPWRRRRPSWEFGALVRRDGLDTDDEADPSLRQNPASRQRVAEERCK